MAQGEWAGEDACAEPMAQFLQTGRYERSPTQIPCCSEKSDIHVTGRGMNDYAVDRMGRYCPSAPAAMGCMPLGKMGRARSTLHSTPPGCSRPVRVTRGSPSAR